MDSSTNLNSIKVTPELKAIAKTIKDLTIAYAPTSKGKLSNGQIKSLKSARKSGKGKAGWTGPGNLKRKLNTANTYESMIGFDTKGEATITIDYAPPGAEYGQYWNQPYTNLSHRPEYDFAFRAVNDPKVEKLINDYVDSLTNQLTNTIQAQIGTKK